MTNCITVVPGARYAYFRPPYPALGGPNGLLERDLKMSSIQECEDFRFVQQGRLR
jgi:hypothetical protein